MRHLIPIILALMLAGCNTFRLPAAKQRDVKCTVKILGNTIEWESTAVDTGETPRTDTPPQP